MDKQKQIEEMAKDLAKINGEYLANCPDSCDTCPYGNCRGKFAVDLYNAGYRKIPENAVVLTQEEWAVHHEQFAKAMYQKEVNTRKETAEKFRQKMLERGHTPPILDEIYKEITEGK